MIFIIQYKCWVHQMKLKHHAVTPCYSRYVEYSQAEETRMTDQNFKKNYKKNFYTFGMESSMLLVCLCLWMYLLVGKVVRDAVWFLLVWEIWDFLWMSMALTSALRALPKPSKDICSLEVVPPSSSCIISGVVLSSNLGFLSICKERGCGAELRRSLTCCLEADDTSSPFIWKVKHIHYVT